MVHDVATYHHGVDAQVHELSDGRHAARASPPLDSCTLQHAGNLYRELSQYDITVFCVHILALILCSSRVYRRLLELA